MTWIYLSPHFDDAAYSCGGMIWEQVQAGEVVEIWTVCAGNPPEPLSPYAEKLHQRWGAGPKAVAARRREDGRACELLGVQRRLFDLPDCIYRRTASGEPIIAQDEDLFTPLRADDEPLVGWLRGRLVERLPRGARLVCPLMLGGHMDHRLVRAGAEAAAAELGMPLYAYPDFPYVVLEKIDLKEWIQPDWKPLNCRVSRAGLAAWQSAVEAYQTQFSSFWTNTAEMRAQLEAYWQSSGGMGRLWAINSF